MKSTDDARRWSEIRAAFDQLVELDATSRNERLVRIGATDPDLRLNIETLLAADADAVSRLARIEHALSPFDHIEEAGHDADPLKLAGRTVSHFTIVERLAAGGMGVVYRADDTKLQRTVALKFPLPWQRFDAGVKERFLHEARSAGALDHPNICSIYETGETEDGQFFLAMPLYDGETLKTRLARDGALPIEDAIGIATQIAAGLSAAHRAGIVHRDVKPANVMLLRDGTVKILDFGLAKVHDLALTAARARLGTVAYMAPEQIEGLPVDGRADLWALGVVLYEMLTSQRPFGGEYDVAVAHAIVHVDPMRASLVRSDITAGLDKIVAKLLCKDPSARYSSAGEAAAAIAECQPGEAARHWPLRPRDSGGTRPRITVRTAALALPVFAAIAAVVVAGFLTLRKPASSAPAPMRLAVLPLENRTGNPALNEWGEYAGDVLTRSIDLAGPVAVIPASTVRDAIRALGSPEAPSPADVARRTGASHVVTGSMARVGGSIRFDIEFADARSVVRLLSPDPVSGPADSLEAVIGRLAERTAAASLAVFQQRPAWMGGYTLPSTIGMYRDYLATFQLFCQTRFADVIATGNRVLEKSPEFVPVMGLVRTAYWNVGRTTEADSVHGRLEQLRDRMTPSERVEHDWMGGLIDGDTSLTARSAEEMFRIDPTSKYGFAAGFTAFRLRRLEAAVEYFLAVDLDLPCQSAWFPWWRYTAAAYHLLSMYEEELALAQRGAARFPDHPGPYDMELRAAAANGRLRAIDSLLARVADLPPPGSAALGTLAINAALELRAHGHAERADRFIEVGMEWFESRPPAEHRSERGQAFLAAGRWADADTLFAGVIRAATAADNPAYSRSLGDRGVALARLGRHDEALEVSRRLERIPGRPVLTSYGTAARAAIAAARGDSEGAIRLLGDAFQHGYPYDISMHQSPWWDPLRNEPAFRALILPKK